MTPTIVISLLCAYFLVLILISWFTARKADNDAFFLGERKSPWYIVAFGMIGASLSGITFISIPGWVGDSAKQFSYMQMVFGYLVGYFVVAYVLMPIYYKLNLTSIYSYLKTRFGKWSYKTGSALFLISRIIGASIRLLLVASVLQLILFEDLGVPFEITVLASVLLIWVYTNRGGIKTIIWTDTLQTAFMLASVIVTVYFIGDALNINEKGGIIEGVKNSGYSRVFYFDNWLDGNYFWKHFLGGIFITIGMTGLDQDMMQKNLSCKNLKDAQLNMISFAGVLVVVNLVFLALGALLYMYFDQTGVGYNALKVIKRTDLLFAEIAQSGKLGITVSVLFLLGLIAAAYSSADSALTSLTTSFSVDFLKLEDKEENQQKKIRQQVHIGMSIVLVVTIIILRRSTDDAAIWTLITLAGFTYGPLIGLFFFGILTKRNLKDYWVPWICGFVPVLIGIIWYLNKNGLISWFGKYQIGAELIIYNAIVSFISLWFISYKPKS
ncbi:MAG: sodium:solute symporter [Bacteroidota bacterium]|nr:sodium:solute symporter [Bacteroidota bacterium]